MQNNYGQAHKKTKDWIRLASLSEEMDKSLFEFLENEHTAGHDVINKMLQKEALRKRCRNWIT